MECNSVYTEAMERCPENFPYTIISSPSDTYSHICRQRQHARISASDRFFGFTALAGRKLKWNTSTGRVGSLLHYPHQTSNYFPSLHCILAGRYQHLGGNICLCCHNRELRTEEKEFSFYGEWKNRALGDEDNKWKNRALGDEDNKWKAMVYTDGACARLTILP
jgi:hypothetical protein